MTELIVLSLIGTLTAFLVSTGMVPLMIRLGMAVRAVDYPGGRRRQSGATPRVGGVAILAGLAAGAAVTGLSCFSAWQSDVSKTELTAFTAAVLLIFLTGLLEDTIGLSTTVRFAAQGAAALVMVSVGWSFGTMSLPLVGDIHLGLMSILVSVFWIVGVTNAVNFLDGLDGLAGGVVAIIAASLGILGFVRGDAMTLVLMAPLVGACLGFLRHNRPPARIYMGDAGSLTLGFLLALLSIYSSTKASAAVAFLVPVLALGLPVIDTLLVMALRFFHRRRSSLLKRCSAMFRADRNHLHHLLVQLGKDRSRVVLVIYLVAASFCAMALIVAATDSMHLGIFLVLLEILVIYLMRRFGLQGEALRLSLAQREQARRILQNMKLNPAHDEERAKV
jgi:UDP-GlcNAc:undecaprenyl-phosphate/decaprenyl-phosphate GlcNAc-1-phosphate transferase